LFEEERLNGVSVAFPSGKSQYGSSWLSSGCGVPPAIWFGRCVSTSPILATATPGCSNFRRQLFNHIDDPQNRLVIKGIRWLLLKNPEDLNACWEEQNRL
jgi:hypothetical protein